MEATKFASTFAPYTPPPDDPSVRRTASPAKPSRLLRGNGPWFSSSTTNSPEMGQSYQSGAIPTFGSHVTNAIDGEEGGAGQLWETRFNWRVDMSAASTYILGPITALLFLILETSNDFVRFHAYQAALLTVPLWLIRVIASFIFPSVLQTLLTILIILVQIGMAFRAYRDASRDGLARYELPYIGELADRWVVEE